MASLDIMKVYLHTVRVINRNYNQCKVYKNLYTKLEKY